MVEKRETNVLFNIWAEFPVSWPERGEKEKLSPAELSEGERERDWEKERAEHVLVRENIEWQTQRAELKTERQRIAKYKKYARKCATHTATYMPQDLYM